MPLNFQLRNSCQGIKSQSSTGLKSYQMEPSGKLYHKPLTAPKVTLARRCQRAKFNDVSVRFSADLRGAENQIKSNLSQAESSQAVHPPTPGVRLVKVLDLF